MNRLHFSVALSLLAHLGLLALLAPPFLAGARGNAPVALVSVHFAAAPGAKAQEAATQKATPAVPVAAKKVVPPKPVAPKASPAPAKLKAEEPAVLIKAQKKPVAPVPQAKASHPPAQDESPQAAPEGVTTLASLTPSIQPAATQNPAGQNNARPGDYNLGEGDAPTYARQVPPEYPARARRDGRSGKVLLRVYINASGLAEDVQVLSSTHPVFTGPACTSARRSSYVPLRLAGVAQPCWVRIPISFNLVE